MGRTGKMTEQLAAIVFAIVAVATIRAQQPTTTAATRVIQYEYFDGKLLSTIIFV